AHEHPTAVHGSRKVVNSRSELTTFPVLDHRPGAASGGKERTERVGPDTGPGECCSGASSYSARAPKTDTARPFCQITHTRQPLSQARPEKLGSGATTGTVPVVS